jgi:hypothetical protein
MRNILRYNHFRYKFISSYLKRTESYSSLHFVFEIGLLSFILKVLVSVLITPLFPNGAVTNTEILDNYLDTSIPLFAVALIIAPIAETFSGQWLPITLASLFTRRKGELLVLSAIFFAFLHLNDGWVNFWMTLPIGLSLSFSFLVNRQKSFLHAYWVTVAIHSLHNLIALGIYFLIVKSLSFLGTR